MGGWLQKKGALTGQMKKPLCQRAPVPQSKFITACKNSNQEFMYSILFSHNQHPPWSPGPKHGFVFRKSSICLMTWLFYEPSISRLLLYDMTYHLIQNIILSASRGESMKSLFPPLMSILIFLGIRLYFLN